VKRREFIILLGGAATWPLAARAQQFNKSIRLGFLGPTLNTPPAVEQYEAFRTQLAELGLRDGQNVTIDYKGLDNPRGPFVAVVDLMRSPPDLIVSVGPEASLQAVVGATGFIPVVMIAINYDPLERGYVASLARPGGNITGLVFQQLELAQKQAELLTQAFPERKRVACSSTANRPTNLVPPSELQKRWVCRCKGCCWKNRPTTSMPRFVAPHRAARRWRLFYPALPSCRIGTASSSWQTHIDCHPCLLSSTGPEQAGLWLMGLIL
jgi:hypothetical protein